MINLALATDFNDSLLDKIAELNKKYYPNKVSEIYGSLPMSKVGSLRETRFLPNLNVSMLEKHIQYAHKKGIEFDYVLNASCLGGMEYTSSGFKAIIKDIDQIVDAGIDRFTIVIPYLMSLVKERYPKLKVTVSTAANILSVQEALRLKTIGIDRIVLSKDANRNFGLLEQISRTGLEIEALVNTGCIMRCPWRLHHINSSSHGSQVDFKSGETFISVHTPCMLECMKQRLENPVELIKSPWITPQNLYIYENLGIHFFKLAGREERDEERLINMAQAYLQREYKGNLYDLISPNFWSYQHLYIKELTGIDITPLPVYIDTQEISTLIPHIQANKIVCHYGCYDCRICENIAKKTIQMDMELANRYLKIYKEFTHKLYSSDL